LLFGRTEYRKAQDDWRFVGVAQMLFSLRLIYFCLHQGELVAKLFFPVSRAASVMGVALFYLVPR
jgi:putative effector of murein hydrolase LrgA (UPF0299 family)